MWGTAVDLYRGETFVGTVEPGKNQYIAENQPSNEMAVHTDWLRAEDVVVEALQTVPTPSAEDAVRSAEA